MLTTVRQENHEVSHNNPNHRYPSDARLVEETRRGNQDAFRGLVLRYERRLIRTISQFVRDHELSRDLAQETFLRAFERLNQFDPSRRFGPWLFRMGVNLTIDYLRKHNRRKSWHLFSQGKDTGNNDPSIVDPRNELDLREEVQTVLQELPDNYRVVLVLRDLQNFSTSEIAATLGRKQATIRWRLAEARRKFHSIWMSKNNDHSTSENKYEEGLPTTQ